jgi:hypothetical protein
MLIEVLREQVRIVAFQGRTAALLGNQFHYLRLCPDIEVFGQFRRPAWPCWPTGRPGP